MTSRKLPLLEDADINSSSVVFVRIDCNVPLNDDGTIADTFRLDAVVETLEYIRDTGAKTIITGALGRPKGKRDEKLTTHVVAQYFQDKVFNLCTYIDQCVGDEVVNLVASLSNGEAVMLENLRFFDGEESNDINFAKQLSDLATVYVNDAFGQSHRNQASIVGITEFLPSYAGKCLAKEVNALEQILSGEQSNVVAVVGGSKVSDKLGVIQALLDRCDYVLVGGGMAYTFLKSQGKSIGDSLCEDSYLDQASTWLKTDKIILPTDWVVANDINSTDTEIVSVIADDQAGFDIGPDSRELFSKYLQDAKVVLWNGPMGVFEKEQFNQGTNYIARTIADLDAYTIIGGGDSVAAIRLLDLQNEFSHVSTGGGATLEYIESGSLVGVDALEKGK